MAMVLAERTSEGAAGKGATLLLAFRRGYAPFPESFRERMETCKRTDPKSEPNCVSTAAFITGEVGKDEFIEPNLARSVFLYRLPQLERPVVGCLVSWTLDLGCIVSSEHMGVVASLDPVRVVNRKYTLGSISIQRLDHISRWYDVCKVEYYLPSELDSRYDLVFPSTPRNQTEDIA